MKLKECDNIVVKLRIKMKPLGIRLNELEKAHKSIVSRLQNRKECAESVRQEIIEEKGWFFSRVGYADSGNWQGILYRSRMMAEAVKQLENEVLTLGRQSQKTQSALNHLIRELNTRQNVIRRMEALRNKIQKRNAHIQRINSAKENQQIIDSSSGRKLTHESW